MNRKIAIVTDSSCDLPDSLLQEYDIRFVPLHILFEGHDYRDRLDLTSEGVFEMQDRGVPQSGMPGPQDMIAVMDDLEAQGYTDVVYLSISSGLSGAYNMAKLVAQQYANINMEVIDTTTVSMGLGFLAVEAAKEARRTNDPKAVVEKIRSIRPRMAAIFAIRTLEHLIKGGRISKIQATLGRLMDVKPVISFETDGHMHTLAKAIGFKNAIQRLLQIIKDNYGGKRINVAVVHAAAFEEVNPVLDEIRKFATVCQTVITQITPVLGVYSGRGLVGVVAYEAE